MPQVRIWLARVQLLALITSRYCGIPSASGSTGSLKYKVAKSFFMTALRTCTASRVLDIARHLRVVHHVISYLAELLFDCYVNHVEL